MWFKAEENVDTLISKGKFDRAAQVLQKHLKSEPKNTRLRQQLGDVLGRAGRTEQAIAALAPLVYDYAQQGFSTKAIAVVKKIQRLDPTRSDTDRLIAKVQGQADSPGHDAIPLISAHTTANSEPPPSRPTPEPEQSPQTKQDVPEATSKFDSDWLEKATARSDFHWSPILNHLSSFDLNRAIGQLRLLTKHSGSIIYGQGDPAENLYILATGFARVFDRRAGEPYRQTAVFEEGQFFGEEAFFAPEEGRKTTVTAACDCELLELDLSTLRTILHQQHEVLDQLEGVYRSRSWTNYQVAI